MKRTFLVELDIEPMAQVEHVAEDIQSALEDEGYPVTSVKPWASPGEGDNSVGAAAMQQLQKISTSFPSQQPLT